MMQSILSPEAAPLIDDIARAHALVALDFDGTLAPISPARDAVALRPETRSLLRALALLQPCCVISGRARSDVAARVSGVPLAAVIGNHGAEAGHGPVDRSRRALVLAWKRVLLRELGGTPGIDVEDKVHSLAVHYRHAASRPAARHLIRRAVAPLGSVRIFGGRAVVNLVPSDAPHKGVALAEVAHRIGAHAVLYVGDDRTDEDVFRSSLPRVAVRVGRTRRSAAAHYLPTQLAIDELLRALIVARLRADGLSDHWEGFVRAVA